MAEIVIMGELLVEIMRAEEDVQLYETGKYFRGPFPSGAPGIFVSTAARLGHSASLISGAYVLRVLLSVQQLHNPLQHPHPIGHTHFYLSFVYSFFRS